MNVVTSITAWNDAVGKRLSMTYSEIDETGKIIADNKRKDIVVTDSEVKADIDKLMDFAQSVIDG